MCGGERGSADRTLASVVLLPPRLSTRSSPFAVCVEVCALEMRVSVKLRTTLSGRRRCARRRSSSAMSRAAHPQRRRSVLAIAVSVLRGSRKVESGPTDSTPRPTVGLALESFVAPSSRRPAQHDDAL